MAQYIDKEFSLWWKGERTKDYNVDILYERYSTVSKKLAKHFFELGMQQSKNYNNNEEIKIGETEIYLEDDGGEPPYDGTQWLDLSYMEYEIPKDKFKDGDNVEIIIRKTQKGE